MAIQVAVNQFVPGGSCQTGEANEWALVNEGVPPVARSAGGMTFDLHAGKGVMFGGAEDDCDLRRDTWTWEQNEVIPEFSTMAVVVGIVLIVIPIALASRRKTRLRSP